MTFSLLPMPLICSAWSLCSVAIATNCLLAARSSSCSFVGPFNALDPQQPIYNIFQVVTVFTALKDGPHQSKAGFYTCDYFWDNEKTCDTTRSAIADASTLCVRTNAKQQPLLKARSSIGLFISSSCCLPSLRDVTHEEQGSREYFKILGSRRTIKCYHKSRVFIYNYNRLSVSSHSSGPSGRLGLVKRFSCFNQSVCATASFWTRNHLFSDYLVPCEGQASSYWVKIRCRCI